MRFFRTTLPKLQRLRAGLTHTGPCLSSDDSVVGDERSADANSAENAAESTSAGGPSVSPYVTHESGPDTTSTADGDTGAGGAHHGDSHDSSDSDTGSMTDGNVSVGLLCELLVVALATMRVQPPKEWTAAYLGERISSLASAGAICMRMRASMSLCLCIHVCVHACVRACLYTCVRVCVCVCVCVSAHSGVSRPQTTTCVRLRVYICVCVRVCVRRAVSVSDALHASGQHISCRPVCGPARLAALTRVGRCMGPSSRQTHKGCACTTGPVTLTGRGRH